MNLVNKATGKRTGNGHVLQVPCPACQREVAWSQDNPHRPFCTERCKTADFIAWANEEQRIPGNCENEHQGG